MQQAVASDRRPLSWTIGPQGGVAADLPQGWDGMFRDFLAYMPPRLREYDSIMLRNQLFRLAPWGLGTAAATTPSPGA